MATLTTLTVAFVALLIAAWLLTQITFLKAARSCDDCCDIFEDDNPKHAQAREAGRLCDCGCDC